MEKDCYSSYAYGDNGGLALLRNGWVLRLKNAVVPFLFIGVINVIIKDKCLFVIVKDAQFYDVEEVRKKIERPLVALKRLKQGKDLPKTFRDIAISDLEQAVFLLEGTKELLNDKEFNEDDISIQ